MKNLKIKIFISSFIILFSFISLLSWGQDDDGDGEVIVKLKGGKIMIRALSSSPVEAGETINTTFAIENKTKKPLKLDVTYKVIPRFNKEDRKYKRVLKLPPESNRKFILKNKINRLAYQGGYNLHFQLRGPGIRKMLSTYFQVEDNHDEDEIPFQVINVGCYGNREDKRRLVIKNQDELDAFLKEDNPVLIEPCNETPPEINFEEDMLIAVFMGRKATGRYYIDIKKISKNENSQLVVSVIEYSPGYQCGVPEGETTPFEIIKLKKTDDEVIFLEKEITYSCN